MNSWKDSDLSLPCFVPEYQGVLDLEVAVSTVVVVVDCTEYMLAMQTRKS